MEECGEKMLHKSVFCINKPHMRVSFLLSVGFHVEIDFIFFLQFFTVFVEWKLLSWDT